MGNPVLDGRLSGALTDGTITKFYTSTAWIDGRAEQQLGDVVALPGVIHVAGFPDLHPGKYGPVGCAVLADRIYPQLIGNDIGCGMALYQLDLEVRKLSLDRAERRLRVLDDTHNHPVPDRLAACGLPIDLLPEALGTIGGGNHFCEVQKLAASDQGDDLDPKSLYLLVHSGSRGVGHEVFQDVLNDGLDGLFCCDPLAQHYLERHDVAVTWARLNRQILAERVASALRTKCRLIVDAPHNLVAKFGDHWLHRKGAAVAHKGLVPLAGTRATRSYLMRDFGHPRALGSLSHGAGRKYDRHSMHGRVRSKRSDLEKMTRNSYGGRIICEDRDLLIEEAPRAYKSAADVLADLKATGAAGFAAEFHPLLTFKKTRDAS